MTDYEELQRELRFRYFVIGWRPCNSHNKTHHHILYGSWHDANRIRNGLQRDQPGYVFFVEAATNIKPCPSCGGTGHDNELKDACVMCQGVGKIDAGKRG